MLLLTYKDTTQSLLIITQQRYNTHMESELKTETTPTETSSPESAPQTPQDDMIEYDTFSKIKLRVAKILNAERVPKSEKLLKLQVTLGETLGNRQILAGIGKHYEPESLIGKNIVVVANLKPAKLMGQESQGMLLAASNETGELELLQISDTILPGGSVK